MNHYRHQFKQILAAHRLDHVLVYGNNYDDRFLTAISGTPSLQPILPTEGEHFGLVEVLKKIGKKRKLGIAGCFKYADIVALEPAKAVDLTHEAHEIILYKSDEYISAIKQHARATADVLNRARFRPGDTGISHARKMSTAALKNGYESE
jgi:Xaa-Pro aminopeptidase